MGSLGTGLKHLAFTSSLVRRTRPNLLTVISYNCYKQPESRHLSTSSARLVKEISSTEVGDKIIIEGKIIPSSREKYLARLPTPPGECKECPLCKLGLQVRHTDVLIISQFINSKGKQLPQEVTGLCKDQHRRMQYLIVMAEKAGLIERDVERTVIHNDVVLYAPEEWEDPKLFNKYYDESVIDEFLYSKRKRH